MAIYIDFVTDPY